ncbi:peptidyl-prolyl cis-trans isomerase, partial [Campylobacter coli]|nr:peptidyl-prolyl cis-trans isomerase [Campylobacter coli]EAK4733544.1 peptidyl-prolyl cis-trans isomerase [Campylobacter coli]
GKIMSFEAAKKDVAKDYALAQLKNIANAKFLELKEGKDKFQKDENITDSDVYYPLEALSRVKNGDVLRPSEYQNGYIIIKLNKTNPVRTKTFDEAKEELMPIYISEQVKKNLEEKAKQNLENFSGTNIGFVSRDTVRNDAKISNILNEAEFSYFLMNVFNSDQNRSYVILNEDKAMLYKINKQKLDMNPEKFQQYRIMLNQNLQSLKANEMKQELIEELKKTYPIKIYYKGK